ncbi:hypothetical protein WDL1P1_00488 (plasmid) [Variovorax sp. WDL1]|nr:hypothetical protein CHC06_06056 [Variovorax sp. B2]PNG51305.1 hypothetical protein CHC07_05962 [Variovorax sp. B4]VTV17564.1 hypothetical protein WDL1P1_00488 [Variovorax sp. WDL1]
MRTIYRATALWFAALAGSASAQSSGGGQFRPLMQLEGRIVFARVLEGGLQGGRYVGVQSISQDTGRGASGLNTQSYTTFFDCNQPRRMSLVAVGMNKEPDVNAPPKWEWMQVEGSEMEFKPQQLTYESIADHERAAQADLAAKGLGGRKVPSSYQAQASFGCEVAREPAKEEQVAKRLMRTADVPALTELDCEGKRRSGEDYPVGVRFSQREGVVQMNDRWIGNSQVTEEDVRAQTSTYRVVVNRKTGKFELRAMHGTEPGNVLATGSCEVATAQKNKF